MAQFDEKVALFRRYADKLKRDYPVHAKGNIPSKKIDNAIKSYAYGLERTTIIGLVDTTVWESGKTGAIFTDTRVYYKEFLESPRSFRYSDIQYLKERPGLEIGICGEEPLSINYSDMRADELKEFLEAMIELVKND